MISRIVERGEMDLMPLVQLFQGTESANLSATIGGVQKKGADPKYLHRCVLTPRRSIDGAAVLSHIHKHMINYLRKRPSPAA
jgi:hypothetical protein